LKKWGRLDEARAEYERSLQMDPENGVTWYNYGNMLNFSLNQPAQAKTAYAKAVECSPLLIQAYFNTGNACLKLKEYGEALRAFENYIGFPQADPSLAREAGEIVRKIKAERVKGK
jgi:tetratricopeptide (TPR) repeat protein